VLAFLSCARSVPLRPSSLIEAPESVQVRAEETPCPLPSLDLSVCAMAGADALPSPTGACPQCGASDATLSLLTSMHRYFACRRCNHRWQIAQTRDENPQATHQVEPAETSRES
jgi:hypothetical protein